MCTRSLVAYVGQEMTKFCRFACLFELIAACACAGKSAAHGPAGDAAESADAADANVQQHDANDDALHATGFCAGLTL